MHSGSRLYHVCDRGVAQGVGQAWCLDGSCSRFVTSALAASTCAQGSCVGRVGLLWQHALA